MTYDFDTPVDRRGTGSLKWDVAPGELPMWVADMDFPAAPEIRRALEARLAQGVYGYSVVPQGWFESYRDWWQRRHHVELDPEWMMFCTGVVPAISSVVRKVTTVGENVLIQAPVYNIFYNSIENNGRHILSNDLVYEDGAYRMDFQDLEEKLALPQTTLMILCNPHNPVGKLWDRETLARVAELCKKHHVLVLSDEIHCDITLPGREYTPFLSVSEAARTNSITCIAPTKCFNLAGMQTACIVVPDPVLRHKVNRGINTDEVAEPNTLAVTAAMAAFNEAEPWLEALRVYLEENRRVAARFLEKELPQLHLVPGEATYLLWIDCGKVTEDSRDFVRLLRETTGLFITAGNAYGPGGKTFVRVNIACPRSLLLDGLDRLKRGTEAYQKP